MLDKFSCGLFVSNIKTRKIETSNDYLSEALGYSSNELLGLPLSLLFSKASLIFLDSYVYPTLLKEQRLFEIQMVILNKKNDKIPIIANINIQNDKFYWSIFTAINRDKLYQELLDARDTLEQQAEALEQAATTDPLTSLLNRRAAGINIDALIEQARRSELSLSFAMIDIDYFKRVNDQLGHHKGDEILVEVAKALQQVCRTTDVVARWGGEEFLIVLYDTPFSHSNDFCLRLHSKINEILVFNHPLTVSIGITSCDLNKNTSIEMEEVIRQADEMLFKAKREGRNKTEASIYR